MSRHPEVKWAEREDKVFITVLLPDANDAKVNLEPDGVFAFTASAGAGNQPYEIKLNLHDKVNVEESKINVGVRSIFCIVEKAEKSWWKKLVRDQKTPHYVKVDWDKWVDEDDDDQESGAGAGGDMGMGGMDFSKFANMGGMGMGDDAMGMGMGGPMGMGMGGGMGGPMGMGMGGPMGMGMGGPMGMGGDMGMGGPMGMGMGGDMGMGGMGDDLDDSEDDDQEVSNKLLNTEKDEGGATGKIEGEAPVGKEAAAPSK